MHQVEDYFRSLAMELAALKDRVRHLIESSHWQTDGEWKETVVRQILRRHLPQSVAVGRGFVVTAERSSSQLDVLITDASKPALFKDGDLAFVTPDAVLGVIEVKSRATPAILAEAAQKLATDMLLIRVHPNIRAFAEFFAFDDGGGRPDAYLRPLVQAAERWESRVDYACIGDGRFIRYWELNPEKPKRFLHAWHSYRLPGLAPGYFVHNVVDSISPEAMFRNNEVWFPRTGKEPFRDGMLHAAWSQADGPDEQSNLGLQRPAPRAARRRRGIQR